MTDSQSELATHLHTQGYRLTPQRQVILEAVRQAGDHITPEQVYETVHAQQPAISRATIYRTLDFLCEQRLVTAMHWGGQTYYEIAGETPHHHLICRMCGGVAEIDRALIDLLIAATAKKHRFMIDMDHIALFGLCQPCAKQPKQTAVRSPRRSQ
ncbi:MAG: transcriptional repressor [Thermoflexales bacterium]|nr:transcriptional repressor [Thermoflexales bacterium]